MPTAAQRLLAEAERLAPNPSREMPIGLVEEIVSAIKARSERLFHSAIAAKNAQREAAYAKLADGRPLPASTRALPHDPDSVKIFRMKAQRDAARILSDRPSGAHVQNATPEDIAHVSAETLKFLEGDATRTLDGVVAHFRKCKNASEGTSWRRRKYA